VVGTYQATSVGVNLSSHLRGKNKICMQATCTSYMGNAMLTEGCQLGIHSLPLTPSAPHLISHFQGT
jgi:hypothetical protein